MHATENRPAMTRKSVKVITTGNDQAVRTLPFANDMTVADYLKQAGARCASSDALTIDGQPVAYDSPVREGAEIIKAPRITNG